MLSPKLIGVYLISEQGSVSHNSTTATVTIANRYIYDHVGRKKQTFQKTGDANATEVLLAELEYNEIGQLKDKRLHNGMQSTGYTYNPRGWLKTSTSGYFI
jgi:hypothetical protein